MRVYPHSIYPIILAAVWYVALVCVQSRDTFSLDERWICNVKQSCKECLLLSHCSWCPNENKCFSKQLPGYGFFCNNKIIEHEDFGFSIEDNAECACINSTEIEQNCRPPESLNLDEECSGRGQCVCGRCICDPKPDVAHPTKMVLGEYCEFDNFSCDGPKCNEGPYFINQSGKYADEDVPRTPVENGRPPQERTTDN